MIVNLLADNGHLKQAKVGFSWTVFFFGILVPFFRRDFKWSIIMIFVSLLLGAINYLPLSLVVSLMFAVYYNNAYIKDLLRKGFYPASQLDLEILNSKKII